MSAKEKIPERVNIIGAGISGLAAGCYLQMNGFETEIFEKNNRAGGLCTSWNNKGYTINGSLHWLLGSNASNPFHRLWSELVDMDAVEFVNHDIRVELDVKETRNKYGDNVFRLYTNLDRLESYLLDLAPEDERMIRRLISSMRKFQHFEIPPVVDSIPKFLPLRRKIGMIKYLPLLFEFLKWRNVTNFSFAGKLKNPFLKEAFQLLYDGEEVKILIMTVPLAYYDKHGAGYPIGGSYRFIQRIEQRYLSLGGKIRYEAEVEKIITEDNAATGLLLKKGETAYSDITLSAADWNFTVFKALEGRYVDKDIISLKNLEKLQVYPSIFMVSLGVTGSLDDWSHFFRFPLPETLHSPDGMTYERFEVHIYNYDPTLAPEGRTLLSVSFNTDYGDFWIGLYHSDRQAYDRMKGEFANKIIDILDKKIPGIRERIEVVDISTPATINRYTNSWKGSAQGWFPGKNLVAGFPVKTELPGLKNFYYSSHWSVPGGGLPVSIKSARDLAQTICHKYGIKFHTTKPTANG
ncbi:MAG: NAD(P)/FAD-dependent oxidoreductase [Bacteroidales bacterium]|nr:NAD(P)/FAD-dependent oxidoreductase [Bacteroidales bacterium]